MHFRSLRIFFVLASMALASMPVLGQFSVNSTTPSANAVNIPVTSHTISFVFSGVNANPSSASVLVTGSQTGKHSVSVGNYGGGNSTATVSGNFANGEVVTVTLTTGAGLSSPYSFQFTTAGGGGAGKFTVTKGYATGLHPNSAVYADLNKDGFPDLITANQTGNSLSVFLNNGDGTFAAKVDYTTGSGPYGVTAADVDMDGDLDLISANVGNSTFSVLKNNGAGTFAAKQDFWAVFGVRQTSMADVDGDGDLDAVSTGDSQDSVDVSMNNGSGTFAVPSRYVILKGFHVIADVDNDHHLDIVTANFGGSSISVVKNNGDGTFGANSDQSIGVAPYNLTVGDFDGDGDMDLATANYSANSVLVLSNNGSGTFSSSATLTAGTNPSGVTAADIDGDGDLDLITANNGSASVSVFRNSSGTFGTKTDFATIADPQFVSIADVDGDHDLDLVVSSYSVDSVRVMTNAYRWVVNSTTDAVVASAGAGTALTAGGQITLRSAIQEANANGIADDIIIVPAGTYTLTISGKSEDAAATGDLDLTGNMTINGAGEGSTIIDGNSIDRVFHINDVQRRAAITISNLKITGGDPSGDTYYTGGGAILLEDTVDLTLDHVTIDNNTSYQGALSVYVDAAPNVTITNSTISNNVSGSGGGSGLYGYYAGNMVISNSTFSDNISSGNYGAGICTGFDSLRLTNVTFLSNRNANSSGNARAGAIYVANGNLTVDSSTFQSNSALSSNASGYGGSIYINYNAASTVNIKNSSFRTDSSNFGGSVYINDNNSSLSVSNTTFRKNVATKDNGGAVGMENGALYFSNVSLDSNWSARKGGAIYVDGGKVSLSGDSLRYNKTDNQAYGDNGGGIFVTNASFFSVRNSVVTNNFSYMSGGGIFSEAEIDTLSNVVIKHNSARLNGGGMSIGVTGSGGGGGGDRAVIGPKGSGANDLLIGTATTVTKSSVWSNVIMDSNTVDVTIGSGGGSGAVSVPGVKTGRDRTLPSSTVLPAPVAEGGTLLDGRGGGIYDNAGGMNWNGGSMRGNTASYVGGGLYFNGDANSTIQSNVLISGNKANNTGNQIGLGASSYTLTTSAAVGSVYDSVAGSALSFDGDDYAYVSSPFSSLGSGVTVELWVKPTSLPASGKMVIYSSNGRTMQYGIDSTYHFFARFEQGYTDLVYIQGTTVVTANQWYHFAVTVIPGGALKLYVNGNLEASTTTTGSYGGTGIGCLGKMYNGDPQLSSDYHYFTGVIDEVRVWASVRTASEIRTFMHRTMTGATLPNIAFYLQLNENTGVTAYDYSNAKNSTLNADGASFQPSWITSTAPIGGGTAATSSVAANTTGTQTIGNVTLNMTDGFDDPTDVVISEVTAAPSSFPTNYNSSVGSKYFIIDAFPYPANGTFSTTLTLNYGAGVLTDAVASNYILYKRSSSSSGSWTSFGGASSVNTSTGDVSWTNITSFSQAVVVNTTSALPVELASFTANSTNGSVELLWKTATELNNAGFEIERSAVSTLDKKSSAWTKIGAVDGHGTSNNPHEYSFTDVSAKGSVRYRLKQIDHDGNFKYSQTVEAHAAAPMVFALSQNYPNPFNPSTTIEFTLQNTGMTSLKIYDVVGREVATLANENLEAGVYHQRKFDASHLASGIYFARLASGGKMQVRKLLLMK